MDFSTRESSRQRMDHVFSQVLFLPCSVRPQAILSSQATDCCYPWSWGERDHGDGRHIRELFHYTWWGRGKEMCYHHQ